MDTEFGFDMVRGPGDSSSEPRYRPSRSASTPRSRGDKAEPFGGRGASWKGAFVGGELLVHAVTQGPPTEHLYGNFPDYQRYPAV
jgi:hypothetical protein